jgi:transcriptional regulator with XRE-family HTH domain
MNTASLVFFESESIVCRTFTKIENPHTMGQHLKKRREELQLHQRDVANILGVSKESISDWETDETLMRAEYYPAIISFLGYNPFPVDVLTLSKRLKGYRKLYRLSQETLGNLIGVAVRSIVRWESGVNIPQPINLQLLEHILSHTELY